MHRRQILGLMAALAAGAAAPAIRRLYAAGAAAPAIRRLYAAAPDRGSLAAADRLTWWDQATVSADPLQDLREGKFVALEWRYVSGRVTTASEDFGYVVSIADYNPLPPPLTSPNYQELLVSRQDFSGDQAHSTRTYRGALSYVGTTYSFVPEGSSSPIMTWGLNTAAPQRYTFSLSTPELTLTDLILTPQGPLIAEGGDGDVESGKLTVNGVSFTALSDYYADWAAVTRGGVPLGTARVDMQTIRPILSTGGSDFSHHWFCLACTLADDTSAWVTAWRIATGTSTVWCVTVATGRDATWSVASTTEGGFAGAQPLSVEILEWQSIPAITPARRTGSRWRLRQGQATAGDALDLEIAVAPGQFISGARIATASSIPMQEAIGTDVSGSVGGKAIKSVAFAAAESTYSEREPAPARDYGAYLPAVVK